MTTLKFILFGILVLVNFMGIAQQDSKITLDSSNGNDISVLQYRSDSSQTSNLEIARSDSNKIKLEQKQNAASPPIGFWDIVTRWQTLVALLLGILLLIAVFNKKLRNRLN